MRKILMFLAGVMLLTSCGSASEGMVNGAMFGSIIGSAIGGVSGGWRGRDVGTLVGMATGAMAGAAMGAANEQAQEKAYRQGVRDGRASKDDAYVAQHRREFYQNKENKRANDASGYSDDAIYDDVVTLDGVSSAAPTTDNSSTEPAIKFEHAVQIENVRFINDGNTTHIAKGELVKIAFDIRNTTPDVIHDIVPIVNETTGNKRIVISPSTMIENLPGRRALRYTAFVSAQKNLKTGMAHFTLCVKTADKVVSNVVEFDVPLD